MVADPLNAIDPFGLWKYAPEYKTTGEGLSATMRGIEPFVDVVSNGIIGEDATVTYTTNGRHKSSSLHYQGHAVDLRTRDMTPDQRRDALNRLREVLGEDFDVVDEGDHIHVEYDPEWRKQKTAMCK